MIRHDCFIGRFVTFHAGHYYIIRKQWKLYKRPILLLIMDTDEKPSANDRILVINDIFEFSGMVVSCRIIPPISSVNYGRDVGYDINCVSVPSEIEKISGTKIREEQTCVK